MINQITFMLVTGYYIGHLFSLSLPVRLHDRQWKKVTLLLVSMALMQPFWPWPPAYYLRGITGDFSLTTIMLTASAFTATYIRTALFDNREKTALLLIVTLAGAVLYPSSLGVGRLDLYGLGFGNLWFVTGVCLWGIYALYRHWPATAMTLGLALLAWSGNIQESGNLWDYLVDPWVWFYALYVMFKRLTAEVRRSKNSKTLPPGI